MNFYLVTYAISYIQNQDDKFSEDICYVRFLDSNNFCNSSSFLSQLKNVKKLRITSVEWQLDEIEFEDYYEDISTTIH